MAEEKDAFYVVRKGDVIGIYKNLSDCQAQAGTSVRDPSLSIYKGYHLPKEAEAYLISHGLRNASYTINAADVKEDLFGKLKACSYKQPSPFEEEKVHKGSPPKRLVEVLENDSFDFGGSNSFSINPHKKHLKSESDSCVDAQKISSGFEYASVVSLAPSLQKKKLVSNNRLETPSTSSTCLSCVLEFDGASKGNPGKSGAGAILRAEDGSMVCRLQEGVGIATNNVAEYRAVILGMRHALEKGFKHIRVLGDSKLVCMQIPGLWKLKNQNMADLCKEARELKDRFSTFRIDHVLRELNSEADAQANLATYLRDGEVVEDCEKK